MHTCMHSHIPAYTCIGLHTLHTYITYIYIYVHIGLHNYVLTWLLIVLYIIICKLSFQTLGWADIAYNFLIGEDGRVYEGRGWKVHGAHTLGYNDSSVGISFIGYFASRAPCDAALRATQELIRLGVKEVNNTMNFFICLI